MGLLRGISPYDHAGQVNLIAQLAGVAPEQVYSLPFPYPPWYALIAVWLAWLPIEAAARVWFGIGLMLVLLLVPLAILAGEKLKPVDWILLAGAYALPFAALGVWGRQGNFALPLCAAVLLILLYRKGRPLDVSLPAAYNG